MKIIFTTLLLTLALSAHADTITLSQPDGTACTYAAPSVTSLNGMYSAQATMATGSCKAFNSAPPPPPGVCKATPGYTRLLGGLVTHSGLNNTLRQDLTQFATTFTNTVTPSPFPGKLGDEATITIGNTQYVSMAFVIPPGYFAKNDSWPGAFTFSVGTTNMDTKASMSIGTACGSFDPGVCTKVGAKAAGGLQWGPVGKEGVCQLEEGRTYFLSYVNADVSVSPWKTYRDEPGSQCHGKSACRLPAANSAHP